MVNCFNKHVAVLIPNSTFLDFFYFLEYRFPKFQLKKKSILNTLCGYFNFQRSNYELEQASDRLQYLCTNGFGDITVNSNIYTIHEIKGRKHNCQHFIQ